MPGIYYSYRCSWIKLQILLVLEQIINLFCSCCWASPFFQSFLTFTLYTVHLYSTYICIYLYAEMPGVVDYLSTEISTSKQKKFPLVAFVDSPGLVDGDMRSVPDFT